MRVGLAGTVLVLAALLPLPALALSCVEYTIRGAFWSYQHREETYLLVRGEFLDVRPAFPGDKARADWFRARVSGHTASRKAFDQPFEAEVMADFSHITNFTGDIRLSAERASEVAGMVGLIWLRKTETGYEAEDSLCWPLVDTDPANVEPALQCLSGGYCPGPG